MLTGAAPCALQYRPPYQPAAGRGGGTDGDCPCVVWRQQAAVPSPTALHACHLPRARAAVRSRRARCSSGVALIVLP